MLTLGLATFWTLRAEDAPSAIRPSTPVVTLPLERATFNHLGINASINGQPAFLMLDTGSPLTILDASFYRQHVSADTSRQAPVKTIHMATLNHRPTTSGWVQDVQAGAMHLGGLSVAVTDLSGISGAGTRGYHGPVATGILGADILTKYDAIIDWHRRSVSFDADPVARSQSGQTALRQGWTAIPMERTNGRHFAVPCTIGDASYHLIVDTGAALTQIDQSLWRTTDITQGKRHGYMTGISSNTLVSQVVLPDWRIGTVAMNDTPVVVGRFKGSLFHETTPTPGRVVGVLGSEWLASRAGIIDLDGMTLYLK